MAENFWINAQGVNTLKGSETNRLNPPRLPDIVILEFLKIYPKARADYHALYDSLLPEEKYRLDTLLEQHPSVMTTNVYPQEEEDRFQTKMNDIRVNNTLRGQLRGVTQPSETKSGLRINKALLR
jgi:hypothetical protein